MSNGDQEKTKNYYSAHNFATRVIFSTKASLHDGDHDGVDGILMAFPESYTAKAGIWAMAGNRKTKGPEFHTKVSFYKIIIHLCQCMSESS